MCFCRFLINLVLVRECGPDSKIMSDHTDNGQVSTNPLPPGEAFGAALPGILTVKSVMNTRAIIIPRNHLISLVLL